MFATAACGGGLQPAWGGGGDGAESPLGEAAGTSLLPPTALAAAACGGRRGLWPGKAGGQGDGIPSSY